MKGPSEKQKRILEFIADFTTEKGYPPSVREIGAAVGLRSPSTVHAHLNKLRAMGYLQKEEHCTRSLTLVGAGKETAEPEGNKVPILGRVTAGMPILAVEENEGYLTVDLGGRQGNYFALRIQGDSMVDAGILDGDYIIVRQQNFAQNRQIVVAMIDDEATCKRLVSKDGHLWLMPENEAYPPIPGDQSIILGVVVRVIREYHV
ncbi:MAG: transcriptional repressor LexA [Eubacteriales bacterium]|nr:transcriptional repressor LexA [Eubacteriales bacterium]